MASTLRVQRSTWLAEDILGFQLCDPTGAPLPGWQPGAHVSVHLPDGMTREYSLCGDPADDRTWSMAVLREERSRGGSTWIHERLMPGSLVRVEEPRNNFPLEPAPNYVLVAGGIGITPLLAMARELAAGTSDWTLLYCGRSRARMAFLPELAELAGPRLHVHADDEQGGPPALAAFLADLPAATLVFCCGPEPLMTAVREELSDPSILRVERFRAPQPVDPGPEGESSFDVVCAGSGTRVHVGPDISILHALERAGLDVPSSCQEGVCGTCETKVLSGRPDHRDFLLSEEEKARGDTMMICVSRCHSPELHLDIT